MQYENVWNIVAGLVRSNRCRPKWETISGVLQSHVPLNHLPLPNHDIISRIVSKASFNVSPGLHGCFSTLCKKLRTLFKGAGCVHHCVAARRVLNEEGSIMIYYTASRIHSQNDSSKDFHPNIDCCNIQPEQASILSLHLASS